MIYPNHKSTIAIFFYPSRFARIVCIESISCSHSFCQFHNLSYVGQVLSFQTLLCVIQFIENIAVDQPTFGETLFDIVVNEL